MEGAGNLREVADESPVEVHKPYEGLDVLDLHWLWPVCDSLDLNRVHRYVVLRDNKCQSMTLCIELHTFLMHLRSSSAYSDALCIGLRMFFNSTLPPASPPPHLP